MLRCYRLIADSRMYRGVEIGFSLVTVHCSLLTVHCEAVAVLHDLSECAKLFGKAIDPPQRPRERGGISRLKAFRLKVLKPNSLKPNSLPGNSLPKVSIFFHDVSKVFPYVSMAEKGIKGISRGAAKRHGKPLSSAFAPPFPGLPAKFLERVSRPASSSGKCLWRSF